MLGINPSTMVHKLNVCPSVLLVLQKKKVFTQEMDKAIAEEVHKLMKTDFIKEIYYPEWLANMVMVKKENNKWRMCGADFTDLNKACSKDSYPLPRINFLEDSTASLQLLSFIDAFSGYNQINLDEVTKRKPHFSRAMESSTTKSCRLD